VIFITGDFISHNLPLETSVVFNASYYDEMMLTHVKVISLISSYFPKAVLIPTFGNNDYIFHYQAPNLAFKRHFYQSVYDLWFKSVPANAALVNAETHSTFLNGGYYSYLLSENVTVLSMNTLIFNSRDILIEKESVDMLNWVEKMLSTGKPNMKYVFTYHVYPASRYYDKPMALWHHRFSTPFIKLMEKYRHIILIEISGHDHVADLRYHQGPYNPSKEYFNFHNILLGPGMTSISYQNPGISTFEFDSSVNVFNNLKMTFINLNKTLGWTTPYPKISDWPFITVDFKSSFGL
jgi:hypothetical protein